MEQKEDGIWKGSLMKEGRVAKAGYFPADHVVLIDNNGKISTCMYVCCQYGNCISNTESIII